MKLTKVRIAEFQSIQDSTEFEIGDVTCLVGKNEAGKTALLKALYCLNPILEVDGDFDPTDDYPRRAVSDYEDEVEAGRRKPAQVVKARYELELDDITAVKEVFGPECLKGEPSTVMLTKGYANKLEASEIEVNYRESLIHLVEAANLPQQIASGLVKLGTVDAMVEVLQAEAEQTEAVQVITPILARIADVGLCRYIFDEVIKERIPRFLYFDEYYQIKGQDNINALRQRLAQKTLEDSDHPLIGLLELARLDLEQVADPRKTETLLAKLEAAENRLTQTVLTYWSQNRHLRMTFDIRAAQPEDPEGMTAGMNIWGRVRDTRHMVSTGLGSRSRGFVWFFSFLAWYSRLRQQGENLLLLLDEPGLSLHAKAQADLLRYFEEELIPHHQLIYTTHSPFMVDPMHFDRVRIVQDLSIEPDSDDLPEEQQGTKVITEVLDATPDSLFPLQGALGYEIHQSLFIGPNCLVVEGVSDLLYIQTMSAVLQKRGQCGLRADWTITPVGGADKVPTFVALIGAQTNLNVAVIIDFQKKGRQSIENLYKRKLLKKQQVITFTAFTRSVEADIEDMFVPEFYLSLVNGEFGASVSVDNLAESHPRILHRLEEYLKKNPLPGNMTFNHYRPARFFSENIGSLGAELGDETLDRFQRAFDALNKLL